MEDEGYNCEWSQELKLQQSFEQYLDAWIIIHILEDFLYPGNCIFNMSVGYNLEGILKPNVQDFLNLMSNAAELKNQKLNKLEKLYPNLHKIKIPNTISDNITISTMHGCPPEEIESIAKYFIEKRKLHTTVKLNPTLLGKETLTDILKNKLRFDTIVPDEAFAHDLKYPDAIKLINSLQKSSAENNIDFSIKLTNTLESLNHKKVFPPSEKMMYMSGRALHPISISLARKLQNDFNGELDISFSAGADCFNISEILACGIKPVTVCSDLLKPGGYARQLQYLENIKSEFKKFSAASTDEFILAKGNTTSLKEAKLNNLNKYADSVIKNKLYHKSFYPDTNIKTSRPLPAFDCIKAPCVYTCPDSQDIPEYMYYASIGEIDKAFEVIMKSNPFPSVTGMICDHQCQTKCTRINYDNPLLIREVKRFIAENASPAFEIPASFSIPAKESFLASRLDANGIHSNTPKVSIIGAGPSGLSAAFFLALEGFEVEIFDSKDFAGGMISSVIPGFRLSKEAIEKDIKRIESLGVKINYNYKVTDSQIKELIKNLSNNFLYIAIGAQKSKKLNIPGESSHGVIDSLDFLSNVKTNSVQSIGKNIAVIGGGNTAIDTARTAKRVAGDKSKVTLIYRRTKNEMPADKDEIKSMLEEGIELLELTAPLKINYPVLKLTCVKMQLGPKDESGRAKPVEIPGSEIELEFDTIIPAIGQDVASGFISSLRTKHPDTYETQFENVFLGGDALRGASTLIKAIADGKKTAHEIIEKVKGNSPEDLLEIRKNISKDELQSKSTKRIFGKEIIETHIYERNNFQIVTQTLTPDMCKEEASRCLYCDTVCNVCVTVCPNRANISFDIKPVKYFINGKTFSVKQETQIINIRDFCNECGNCTTFCPTSGSPYKDKPGIYLNEDDFQKYGEGYFLNKSNGIKSIKYKTGDSLYELSSFEKYFLYKTNNTEHKINIDTFEIPGNDSLDLYIPAVMSVLLINLPDYLFLHT